MSTETIEIIKGIRDKYEAHHNVKIKDDQMYIMLFTSGTTSEPKAVMLSQKNICHNISYYICSSILFDAIYLFPSAVEDHFADSLVPS